MNGATPSPVNISTLNPRCAAIYVCARHDIERGVVPRVPDLAYRTRQRYAEVRTHLAHLGDLGLVPTDARPPLLIDEVRAEIRRLVDANVYPAVSAIAAALPHRTRLSVEKARAFLLVNGLTLPERQNNRATHAAHAANVLHGAREANRALSGRDSSPCNRDVSEYRRAWKRIRHTIPRKA